MKNRKVTSDEPLSDKRKSSKFQVPDTVKELMKIPLPEEVRLGLKRLESVYVSNSFVCFL